MSTFGYIIRWKASAGGAHQIIVVGFNSVAEAKTVAVRLAKNQGWTLPRWWKLWRRGDISLPCRNHFFLDSNADRLPPDRA